MKKSAHGFTLVELLVVISILAILATVSIILFSGIQKNVRDARRKADINSIAAAIELKKDQYSRTYTGVVDSDFSGSKIPIDPTANTTPYCMSGNTSTTVPADATAANWGTNSPCTVGGTPNYVQFAASSPSCSPTPCKVWKVCAKLENGGVYCKNSIQ